MEALQVLLEDEGIQTLIDEQEGVILESSELLVEFTDVIKEEVMNNLEKFVNPGDLGATYDNIKTFTESAIASFANSLSEELAAATV